VEKTGYVHNRVADTWPALWTNKAVCLGKRDPYRPIEGCIASKTKHNVATNKKPDRTMAVNCFTVDCLLNE
jgi:hypothetical protein